MNQKSSDLLHRVKNLESLVTNKVTTITENSTNDEYPSARAVFNLMENNMINTSDLENELENLNNTNSNICTNLSTKINELTVAVRGIGADFSQVETTVSDVKSGKNFFDSQGVLQSGSIPTFDGNTTITQNGTIPTSGTFVDTDLTVSVPRPQLNPPIIFISGDILSITNPSSNGNFVSEFNIYANNSLLTSTTSTTIDLTEYLTQPGTHTITATCSNTDFITSSASSSVNYVITEDTILTNVSQITALLNDYQTEEDFNTSTREKIQFGTLFGNTTPAKIWFRQKPINVEPQIELDLYVSNLPANTVQIPILIKLNGDILAQKNIAVEDGIATVCMDTRPYVITNQAFNELTIEFTNPAQANAYLDYVDISIFMTKNCIVLNRDTSFEMCGAFHNTNNYLIDYTRVYRKGGINNVGGGIDVNFETLNTSTNFNYFNNNGEKVKCAVRYLFTYYSATNSLYTFLSNYYVDCYLTQNNNLFVNFTKSNDSAIIAHNVIYAQKSTFNGSLNITDLIVGTYDDFEPFIVSFNVDTYYYTPYTQGTIWKLQLDNNDLPKEFIYLSPIQDYFVRYRTTQDFNLGYLLIHKSGNILFTPDRLSTYFIILGKGKQINAYAQQDGLSIHVYFNRDNVVYMKTLTRTSITSNDWELSNNVATYANYKEIKEQKNLLLSIDYNNNKSYIQ